MTALRHAVPHAARDLARAVQNDALSVQKVQADWTTLQGLAFGKLAAKRLYRNLPHLIAEFERQERIAKEAERADRDARRIADRNNRQIRRARRDVVGQVLA